MQAAREFALAEIDKYGAPSKINFLITEKKGYSPADALNYAEKKLEEKHEILSLDVCRQELEPIYQDIKKLINRARELAVDETN